MPIDFSFRRKSLSKLTPLTGVYVLCDLDETPIYVGQSVDGIRSRVQRHLTSARSDIIANRQIDVWEIAWVWAYPVEGKASIGTLEACLFHKFHALSKLFNGSIPSIPDDAKFVPDPSQRIQVLPDEEIEFRKDPAQRLPRQAIQYASIVSHFVTVKNSVEISRAMEAHFERLARYQSLLLRSTDIQA